MADAGARDELKAARKERKAERKQKKAQKKQARADKKAGKKKAKAAAGSEAASAPLALLKVCEDDALEALMQRHFAHVQGITVERLRMVRDLVRAASDGAEAGDKAARARLAEAHAALLAPLA